MSSKTLSYYVPEQSRLPIWMALAMFLTVFGSALMLNFQAYQWVFFSGALLLAAVMYRWFHQAIVENRAGMNNAQLKHSYVLGMGWFIFSEVMFFAAFFGALFYVRTLVGPWLGGEGAKGVTGDILYPGHSFAWPALSNPVNELFTPPTQIIDPYHLPLYNTLLLVTSSFTVSLAHHALKAGKRLVLVGWMLASIIMGAIFIALQAFEYYEAYTHLGLTLNSGIYGSTFFLLTGFHGAHVTIGGIMLTVMLIRILRGHFSKEDHFGFEAASWYWHFVDVVWVLLFLFVYIF